VVTATLQRLAGFDQALAGYQSLRLGGPLLLLSQAAKGVPVSALKLRRQSTQR